jgi:hypothetical protein
MSVGLLRQYSAPPSFHSYAALEHRLDFAKSGMQTNPNAGSSLAGFPASNLHLKISGRTGYRFIRHSHDNHTSATGVVGHRRIRKIGRGVAAGAEQAGNDGRAAALEHVGAGRDGAAEPGVAVDGALGLQERDVPVVELDVEGPVVVPVGRGVAPQVALGVDVEERGRGRVGRVEQHVHEDGAGRVAHRDVGVLADGIVSGRGALACGPDQEGPLGDGGGGGRGRRDGGGEGRGGDGGGLGVGPGGGVGLGRGVGGHRGDDGGRRGGRVRDARVDPDAGTRARVLGLAGAGGLRVVRRPFDGTALFQLAFGADFALPLLAFGRGAYRRC